MTTKIIIYMYLGMLLGGSLLNVSGITPFNLGVVFSIISIFFHLNIITRSRLTRKYVYVLFFFLFNITLTTLFSNDIVLSAKHLFYYFSLCVLMLLSLTITREKSIEDIIKLMVLFLVIFLITTLLEVFAGFRFVEPSADGFINTNIPLGFYGNPNSLSCTVTILFCCTYAWLDYKQLNYIKYAVITSTFIILFFAMSRGALIIFVAYLLMYYIYMLKHKKINSKKYIISYAVIALLILSTTNLVYNFNDDTENVIKRSLDKFAAVTNVYDANLDESSATRIGIIKYVFYNFDEFLFGKGAGMSQVITLNESGFNINPHNLILELYMDGGIFGVLTFTFMYIFLIIDLVNAINLNSISDSRRKLLLSSLILLITYPILTSINSSTIGSSAMYIPLSFALMNIAVDD